MTGDLLIEASQEPLASCDAAFSCLLQLGGQSGGNKLGAVHCRNVVNGETLSISRLIELAGDLGIKAEHARLDWQRLQALGFSYPILALLKNTNVIVLTGSGRGGGSEVSVWDPLNPYGEILVVPREDFERVWTGHALIINTPASNGAGAAPSLDFCWFTSAGLELLGKTSAKGLNPKLPVHRREEAGTHSKSARRMPQQTVRTNDPAVQAELTRAGLEIANEQLPPGPADGTQLSTPALSRPAAERRLSPLVRLGIAAGVIIGAAGSGTFLLRNSATDPVAAAVIFAREVWAVAPNSPQSTDRRVTNIPRAGSTPIPAVPPAAPDLATVPPAAPGIATAPPAAPDPATAPPAAPDLAVAPSAAAAAEPGLTAPSPAAPAPELDVSALPVAPGSGPAAPDARTAVSPPPTAGSRLSAEDMGALLARGDTLLSVGDVASARLFYERAVDARGGLAAIRLGETFDPLFLDRVHLRGVRGDPGAAEFWYRRARDLGATDAEVLLKALEAK